MEVDFLKSACADIAAKFVKTLQDETYKSKDPMGVCVGWEDDHAVVYDGGEQRVVRVALYSCDLRVEEARLDDHRATQLVVRINVTDSAAVMDPDLGKHLIAEFTKVINGLLRSKADSWNRDVLGQGRRDQSVPGEVPDDAPGRRRLT